MVQKLKFAQSLKKKNPPPSVLVGNRAKVLFKSHTNHRPHRVQEKSL